MGPEAKLIDEKTRARKSRDTVSLRMNTTALKVTIMAMNFLRILLRIRIISKTLSGIRYCGFRSEHSSAGLQIPFNSYSSPQESPHFTDCTFTTFRYAYIYTVH